MRKKIKAVTRIVSTMLVLVLATQILPLQCIGIEIQQALAVNEEQRSARSLSKLLASDSVIQGEDGIIGIQTGGDEFSAAELEILYEYMGVELHSGEEAQAAKRETEERVLYNDLGLSKSTAERGIELHGSANELITELANLALSLDSITLDSGKEAKIRSLIEYGYTNSEAFAALVACDVLGVSIDAMKLAKAASVEAECASQNAPFEINAYSDMCAYEEEAECEDLDYIELSTKMGVPYSVIEKYMADNPAESIEALDARYIAAKKAAYPPTVGAGMSEISREGAAPQSTSSSSSPFIPEEIMEKAYSYDSLNAVNVNLNTGSYTYTETDLSLPGKNGLDLDITRLYSSTLTDTSVSTTIDPAWLNNDVFGVGFKFHLYNGVDANGDLLLTPITSFSNYTFPAELQTALSAEGLSEFSAPYYLKKFSPSNYSGALAYYEYLQVISYLDPNNTTYANAITYIYIRGTNTIQLVFLEPTLIGIEPAFMASCQNTVTYNDSTESKYGLSPGWMFGFSSIETYFASDINQTVTSKKRLITATGQRLEIDDGDFADYKSLDMQYFDSGGGYPGATDRVKYKDGTVEYFDTLGRNIAIVNKYGDAITLSYTYSNNQLSAITIIDTLGNEIVYSDCNVDQNQTVIIRTLSGKVYYNSKWTLTLNDNLVKEYYMRKSSSRSGNKLSAVADANGAFTTYSAGMGSYKFNSFVPTSHTNDGIKQLPRLSAVCYPTMYRLDIGFASATEHIGISGYQTYITVSSIYEYYQVPNTGESAQEYHQVRMRSRSYEYDDYSRMLPAYSSYCIESSRASYTTKVTDKNCKYIDGTTYIWPGVDTTYTFGDSSNTNLLIEMEEQVYPALNFADLVDSDTWLSMVSDPAFTSNITRRVVTYQYDSSVYYTQDLPTNITTKHYNAGSSTRI